MAQEKRLDWHTVDPDDRRSYPPADTRLLFRRKGGGHALFYGVHDGLGMVRSLLRKESGQEYVVCTIQNIEAYAVDGSIDPYNFGSAR